MKTHGPGKYDDLCKHAMRESQAHAAILIVVNGTRGSGFAVKTKDVNVIRALPDMLEGLAQSLRVQIAIDDQEAA